MHAVVEAASSPAASAPGVLVRLSEVSADEDGVFDAWYQRQHLLKPLSIDGFRSARRYRVAGGEPTFMTVYECISTEVLASPASQAALAGVFGGPQPHVRVTMQLACRETWSSGDGIGGWTIVVQCKPMQGREASARRFIQDNFSVGRTPALVHMSLWEADAVLGNVYAPPAPPVRTGPARKRKGAPASATSPPAEPMAPGPLWVLSLESYDINRMALAVHECLLGCESGKTGLLVGSWARYQLISAHERTGPDT